MDVKRAQVIGKLRHQAPVARWADEIPPCTDRHFLAGRQLDLVVSGLGVEADEQRSAVALGA
jgi:hypothetical protein